MFCLHKVSSYYKGNNKTHLCKQTCTSNPTQTHTLTSHVY